MIHELPVRSKSAEIVVERLKNILEISEDEPYMTSRVDRYRVFRHTAMYIIRNNVGLTFAETARIFNKDHSTAIHAYNTVRDQLALANKLGFTKYNQSVLRTDYARRAFDFIVNFDDKPYAALLGDLDAVEAQIRELYGIRRRIKQKLHNNQIYF
jgi:hypothetical protein